MGDEPVRDKKQDNADKAEALRQLTILFDRYNIPTDSIKIDWDTGMIELDFEFKDKVTETQFAVDAGKIIEGL